MKGMWKSLGLWTREDQNDLRTHSPPVYSDGSLEDQNTSKSGERGCVNAVLERTMVSGVGLVVMSGKE